MKDRFAWFLLLCLILFLAVSWRWRKGERERRFDPIILKASKRYAVEPALIKAVVWRESNFESKARGLAGEIGLMQIRSLAAQEWAQAERIQPFHHEQVLDPEKNVMAGAWYLAKLLRRYAKTDNPVPYALADYNAGRTHVLRWMKNEASTNSALFLVQMDFPGTRRYIETVVERSSRYQARLGRVRH